MARKTKKRVKFIIPLLLVTTLVMGTYLVSNTTTINSDAKRIAPPENARRVFRNFDQGKNTLDTLDYFLSDTPEKELFSTYDYLEDHSSVIFPSKNTAIYVKFRNPQCHEIFTWDNNFIYIKYDSCWGVDPNRPGYTSYSFNGGKWMSRLMKVGDSINVDLPNKMVWHSDDCVQTKITSFKYKTTLESHLPSYDLGGDLGKQDVIVLRYDYGATPEISYEKMWYSKKYGWIKWQYFNQNKLVQEVTFNKFSGNTPVSPQPKCVKW